MEANGSGRLLTGRRPQPHSRLSLGERRKDELGHVPFSRRAPKRNSRSDIVVYFLRALDILEESLADL